MGIKICYIHGNHLTSQWSHQKKDDGLLHILLIVNPVADPGAPCFLSVSITQVFLNWVQTLGEGQCHNCNFCVSHSFSLFGKTEHHGHRFKAEYILFSKSSGNSLCMFPWLLGWIVSINPVVLSPGCTLELPRELTRLTAILRLSGGDMIELVMVELWRQYFSKSSLRWWECSARGERMTAMECFKGNVSSAWA